MDVNVKKIYILYKRSNNPMELSVGVLYKHMEVAALYRSSSRCFRHWSLFLYKLKVSWDTSDVDGVTVSFIYISVQFYPWQLVLRFHS